jgi:hypothetical protein
MLHNPRLRGAGLFLVAVFLLVFQVVTHFTTGRVLCATPVLLLYGLWALIVGEPVDPKTGVPLAWAQVGAWLAGVVGIILAVVVLLLLGDG